MSALRPTGFQSALQARDKQSIASFASAPAPTRNPAGRHYLTHQRVELRGARMRKTHGDGLRAVSQSGKRGDARRDGSQARVILVAANNSVQLFGPAAREVRCQMARLKLTPTRNSTACGRYGSQPITCGTRVALRPLIVANPQQPPDERGSCLSGELSRVLLPRRRPRAAALQLRLRL